MESIGMKRVVVGVIGGVVMSLVVRRAIWAWKQTRKLDDLLDAWFEGDISRVDQLQAELADQGVFMEWEYIGDEED